LNGLVLVDKPAGPSSFDVVKALRERYGAKAGHAGTLDPLATGLLLCLLGPSTRLARYLVRLDKRYETEIRLGLRTTTGDGEGEIAEETEIASREAIEALEGEVELTVPRASAVKVGGERAYRLHRRGLAVEMPTRLSTVHAVRVRRYSPPLVELDLDVSSGTYVRALADALGGHCKRGARPPAAGRARPPARTPSDGEREPARSHGPCDPRRGGGTRGALDARRTGRSRARRRRRHPPGDRPAARMRLLRGADFRNFWLGQTISLFGDQVTLIALPLVAVLVLHANAPEMGYLGAAALMPHLLFSLPAGVWLERVGRRRLVMIAADVARAALLATIPVAYWIWSLTFAQLYGVAFFTGCLAVAFDISYSTLFVAITAREEYVEGNAWLNGSRAFSFVAGPSTGGILVQVLSAPAALLADAVSFLVSAFFLGRMTASEPPLEPSEGGMRAQTWEGLRFLIRSRMLGPTLASVATLNFFNFAFAALFILYATRNLGVRPGTLGLVLGAGAVGGLLGAFIAGRLGRRIGLGPAFLVGMILFPAPFLLVPLASGPRPVILSMLFGAEFLSGLGVMILDINVGAMMLALTPHRLRSRFTGAFRFVNYGVRPLGSLFGGALGSAIGLRPTLFVTAAASLAGVLWLLPSPVPRLGDLPEEEAA
jgi:tRNA pseudouridine(55) synthase